MIKSRGLGRFVFGGGGGGGGGGGIILGDLKGDNLHPDFRSPQAGISKLGPFLIGSYRLKGSLII